MAKQYKVSKIEYNQKMSNKYPGAFLHTISVESEAKRRDFVFENSKQFKVLQECAVGDVVELKIVKNGDFFNLAKEDDAIVLVEKQKGQESIEPSTPTDKSVPTKTYSGYKEDPDKQAAIIRQNALTNATNLIIASGGISNVDNAIKYIISTAIQFAMYTSGQDMTEYLLEPETPWDKGKCDKEQPKASISKRVKKDTTSDGPVPEYVGEFGE